MVYFNLAMMALNKAPPSGGGGGTGYKYLGFYTTSAGTQAAILYELIINYTGGTIKYGSVEEIQPSGTLTNSDLKIAPGITIYSTYINVPALFDKKADLHAPGEWVWFNGHGSNRFYFWFELQQSIPDVIDFTYWTFEGSVSQYGGVYDFNNLSIYGTNTNPATMINIDDLSNWTLLSNGIERGYLAGNPVP